MSARSRVLVLLSIPAAALVVACTSILGDFSFSNNAQQSDSGANGADGSSSGDSGTFTDANVDSGCAVSCSDPSTLACGTNAPTACAFGCTTDGGAHCATLSPTLPVTTGDLSVAGTTDVALTQDTQFFTDTGAIENTRAASSDTTKLQVASGVGFRIADDGAGHKVAIWNFKSLSIANGITVRLTGSVAGALVASNTITITGTIDVRGYSGTNVLCAGSVSGAGGFIGGDSGAAALNGTGPGAGLGPPTDPIYAGAPSGGSYGAQGGPGGQGFSTPTANPGAQAGVAYGTPTLSPLLGGSGGGSTEGALGGGGGGAIQLVAGQRITVGGGANPGGVNAGGCNGHGAAFGQPGSAGGSGGAILVETPNLDMQASGVLAANGGGGGSGGGAADPAPGQLSAGLAMGGVGAGGYGGGGYGGAGTTFAGGIGDGVFAGSGGGGAGAGGVGRIRINNLSGSFTPPAQTIVSPTISATSPSTVGALVIQ